MVLNNSNSYSTTATSDEDDACWEMVGDESNNEITTPLVDTTRENNRSNHAPAAAEGMDVTAAVPSVNETAAPSGSVLERTMERQSSHHIGTIDLAGTSNNQNINESTTNQGVDANASIASGMSSITGDHHTVSDVDEDEEVAAEGGEEEEEVVMKDGAANTDDLLLEEDKVEEEQAAPSAGTTQTPRAPEETIEFEGATAETSSDPLVESLSQMGFKKEQIEKAIEDLRESGQEVDADSVIGSMAGETPPEAGEDGGDNRPRNPFHTTWDFVESTAQNIDDQHQLRRRTRDLGENIGRSARDLWSNVREESVRFKSNVRETCDQADVHARTATTQLRHSASNVGETIRRANEEHRIAEKVATVAVVGGATLLAIGNPRAGVATLAVAGASLAAGEALRNSSSSRDRPWRRQQSGEDSPYSPSYNGDHGLSEGLHLD